jgi:hypothetical protein
VVLIDWPLSFRRGLDRAKGQSHRRSPSEPIDPSKIFCFLARYDLCYEAQPAKRALDAMDFDEIALSQHDEKAENWLRKAVRSSDDLCKLASKHNGMKICQVEEINRGSFNVNFTVKFPDDGEKLVVRIPIPGKIMFPAEKLRSEVETLRFIKANTQIPVPSVIAWGDNGFLLGPYMITNFIEGTLLSARLRADNLDEDDDEVLRDDIEDKDLEKIYAQVANYILELSDHNFDQIGSLGAPEGSSKIWPIRSRPISRKMNEIVRCGGITLSDLDKRLPCDTMFSSTGDYLLELAEENYYHFQLQRNSAKSPEDVRRMYASRYLFRAVTPSFVHQHCRRGPFKLYCDDFRPGNMLVDADLNIKAVLDWEFSYAAPVQFLYSPPRWLLLKEPQRWEKEHQSLVERYRSKLEIFLRVLERQESLRPEDKRPFPPFAKLMRESMDDMTFWYHEIARNSFDADYLFWSWLDEFYFGAGATRNRRVHVFTAAPAHNIGNQLDDLIRYKMKQLHKYYADKGRLNGESSPATTVLQSIQETQARGTVQEAVKITEEESTTTGEFCGQSSGRAVGNLDSVGRDYEILPEPPRSAVNGYKREQSDFKKTIG